MPLPLTSTHLLPVLAGAGGGAVALPPPIELVCSGLSVFCLTACCHWWDKRLEELGGSLPHVGPAASQAAVSRARRLDLRLQQCLPGRCGAAPGVDAANSARPSR